MYVGGGGWRDGGFAISLSVGRCVGNRLKGPPTKWDKNKKTGTGIGLLVVPSLENTAS